MKALRWNSTESTPFARGEAFGAGLAAAVANTTAVYSRMFREDIGLGEAEVRKLGSELAEAIYRFRPALASEIEGIAAGSGQPAELLFAVNARTEMLSGGLIAGRDGGECSTVGVVQDDRQRGMLAQTWDFHPDLAASRVVWSIEGGDGIAFIGFTEAGVLSKLGVNMSGVAVGINFLATDEDSRTGGIPVHVLARAVLEEAGTPDEACALIEETKTSASACMTVAGAEADGAVAIVSVERWPGGAERHAAAGSPPHLVHTNHFLEAIAARDILVQGHNGAGTLSRYRQLAAALEADPSCELETLAAALSSVEEPGGGQAVFRFPDPGEPWLTRCRTLATVAFEIPSGRLWLRDGFDAAEPLDFVGQAGRAISSESRT